jgi:hypothetical protein
MSKPISEMTYYPNEPYITCGSVMVTYPLKVADEKWNRFKETLSKNQTINEVIEGWIDERLEEVVDDD